MQRINIRQAVGDPVLAQPLVDERGAFILAAGKPLTSSLANRVWDRGFRHAYVETSGFHDVPFAEALQPQTYSLARRLMAQVIDAVRESRPGSTPELPVEELTEFVAEVCDQLEGLPKGQPLLLYPPWEGRRDQWIAFAVNAAVLAGLLGLQCSVQDGRRLVMAALVQDLGLWRVDRPQDHVTASGNLLRPVRGIGPVVKAIASEHHELVDGSGYPQGKAGDELHELSLRMNVVVAYLEMIGSATKAVLPHDALEGLLAGTGTKYDAAVVEQFRYIVHTYPPGTLVRLSNGWRGVVLEPGPPGLHRPKIRILPSAIGRVGTANRDDLSEEEAEEEYPVVDLASEFSVLIDRVLG